MYTAQSNVYFENSVNTASPARLLILLCDGAIRHCRQGMEAIKQKNFEKKNYHLCKAQDIVREWIITLDKDAEIAPSLLSLYDYFLRRLIDANVDNDASAVEEVLEFLKELKETWVQAELKMKQQGASAGQHVSQYG